MNLRVRNVVSCVGYVWCGVVKLVCGLVTYRRNGFGEYYWHSNSISTVAINNTSVCLVHCQGDVYRGGWKDEKCHGMGVHMRNNCKKMSRMVGGGGARVADSDIHGEVVDSSVDPYTMYK